MELQEQFLKKNLAEIYARTSKGIPQGSLRETLEIIVNGISVRFSKKNFRGTFWKLHGRTFVVIPKESIFGAFGAS